MKEKIITKHPYHWHYAVDYLEGLHVFCNLMKDEGFYSRFRELENYVSEKVRLPTDNDSIDCYVIIEQEK
ncbi:MAG: hypothetical protein FWE22_06850 [Firmicutes bacterium]|nr:hypothetical protein [Bacillota bacterium]